MNSSRAKKSGKNLNDLPFDTVCVIGTNFKHPKDFFNLCLCVKGFYEYVKNVSTNCCQNILFKMGNREKNGYGGTDLKDICFPSPGQEFNFVKSIELDSYFVNRDSESAMEKVFNAFPRLENFKNYHHRARMFSFNGMYFFRRDEGNLNTNPNDTLPEKITLKSRTATSLQTLKIESAPVQLDISFPKLRNLEVCFPSYVREYAVVCENRSRLIRFLDIGCPFLRSLTLVGVKDDFNQLSSILKPLTSVTLRDVTFSRSKPSDLVLGKAKKICFIKVTGLTDLETSGELSHIEWEDNCLSLEDLSSFPFGSLKNFNGAIAENEDFVANSIIRRNENLEIFKVRFTKRREVLLVLDFPNHLSLRDVKVNGLSEYLKFNENNANDFLLKLKFSNCPNLKSLGATWISELEFLNDSGTNLSNIDMRNSLLSIRRVDSESCFMKLEKCQFSNVKIEEITEDSDLHDLEEQVTLEYLFRGKDTLKELKLGNRFEFLRYLEMKSLSVYDDLTGVVPEKDHFHNLFRFYSMLESLEFVIEEESLVECDSVDIIGMKNLKRLRIEKSSRIDLGSRVKNCPKLVSLVICNPCGSEEIMNCEELKRIDFSKSMLHQNRRIEDMNFRIRDLPNLCSLSVFGNKKLYRVIEVGQEDLLREIRTAGERNTDFNLNISQKSNTNLIVLE